MIAKGCLLFTNAFRESRGLPALQWSSQLAVIALAHSIDMGEGRVPMGHDGFQERMAQTPFRWRSFAENVAMMSNPHSFSLFHNDVDDIAQRTVEGWQRSPGHCRNLLSHSNLCGIGVFKDPYSSTYFFTQLLVGV
ncbi:SCP domain-containing protein [Balamuthia mandrillaris]